MRSILKKNYGWCIVAYGILAMIVLHYGCIGSQAIFLLPITRDLGVSTTTLTLSSTYALVIHLFWTPMTGKLMNRRSIRKLMFVGMLGTGRPWLPCPLLRMYTSIMPWCCSGRFSPPLP